MKSTYDELCEARTSLSARAIIIVKSHHEIEELKTALTDAMDMLSNIEYWETTPDEYHDRIAKLKSLNLI